MKKFIAISLCIGLLLSLCGCTTSRKLSSAEHDPLQNNTTPQTDVGVNEEALAMKYEMALSLLIDDPAAWDGAKAMYAYQMERAYELFVELDSYGYKDSAEYLNKFILLSDVLLYDTLYETDESGESTMVIDSARGYHYNNVKRLLYRVDDLMDTTYYYTYVVGETTMVEKVALRVNGKLTQTILYNYSEQGLLMSEELRTGETVDSSTDYTYDTESKLVKKYHHDDKNGDRETIYIYDGADLPKQEVCTLVGTGITYTYTYTYDEDFRLIRSVTEKADANDSDAAVVLTTIYEYENDRLVTETTFAGTDDNAVACGTRVYVYGDYYRYAP